LTKSLAKKMVKADSEWSGDDFVNNRTPRSRLKLQIVLRLSAASGARFSGVEKTPVFIPARVIAEVPASHQEHGRSCSPSGRRWPFGLSRSPPALVAALLRVVCGVRIGKAVEENFDRICQRRFPRLEHALTLAEAARSAYTRGSKNIEYAWQRPDLAHGRHSSKSARGVDCETMLQNRSVFCVGITPSIFPAMVPMWMLWAWRARTGKYLF